ncbi:MAG TPA: glycosyl hydrolase [Ohtaekwangia sp.]|nr:glycosyl hydrolase [Ohtaekwangia sp.]
MPKNISFFVTIIFWTIFPINVCLSQNNDVTPFWPEITNETKPWTRWWWHGSAVTKEGISKELQAFHEAGIGGVEITPIYGVYGTEEKFISFLSAEWTDMLAYTLQQAQHLGLGVDMATGTGWPFGGPWISEDEACRNVHFKTYQIKNKHEVPETIKFVQEPMFRRVGFNVPGISHPADQDDIQKIQDPVSENDNLQVRAIDQIRFKKKLPLLSLMAYDAEGNAFDLTDKVDKNDRLSWKYPGGNWTFIAVFSGWHGKMVERAGPGGEGNVIDHFSFVALKHYLNRFDSAFNGMDIRPLRAFFNDSYEVDDAAGAADWTPHLFEEFKERRGYDLRSYLPTLLAGNKSDTSDRILCDYRETLSSLLLEKFTQPWKAWAHGHGALVRNQAHGSPSNILDLYSAVDIPEIEGTEPLRIKMASSAANVMGKKLVSAEAATWLDEHFQSDLKDVKAAVDVFLLNGVNHVVYHGTAYSPTSEPWPGWLFYAAVHFNTRNPFWHDFKTLNQYVARCQSFLQNSSPDNDILLYYPVYDRFSTPGPEMIEHFDGIDKQFEGTSFARCAEKLMEEGFLFDYISDTQIRQLNVQDNEIRTGGNIIYQTIIIPYCRYIPVSTMQALSKLAEQGATVIFAEGLPQSFSGFAEMKKNAATFASLKRPMEKLNFNQNISIIPYGKGRILGGNNIVDMLSSTTVRREKLKTSNINFIRKKNSDGTIYFLVNDSDKTVTKNIVLASPAKVAEIYDPMTGVSGTASTTISANASTSLRLSLAPRQTLIIKLKEHSTLPGIFPFYTEGNESISLDGTWQVDFMNGGPTLPPSLKMDSLESWTNAGPGYEAFSGRVRYTLMFSKPPVKSSYWKLELGDVKESAVVYLNGKHIGTCIGPAFTLVFQNNLLREKNSLEIVVSNTMANRIAYMDREQILWKRFYNINFPARKPVNSKQGLFNASEWQPAPSGLLGPVRLKPVVVQPER